MNLKIFKSYEQLSKATAQLIADYVNKKKISLICLASGHTPVGVFHQMKQLIDTGKLDLSRCTFLSLDEWIGVDPDDPGSCLAMLKKDCFDPLNIHPRQIEFFNIQTANLEDECGRINALIEKNGGLDIMLVGVGTNGHIGMNEPGTSFSGKAHISKLAEETIKVGQKYFERPTALATGITLGLQHLRDAKLPVVMASGEAKAAIIAKGLQQPPGEQVPLSVVQLIPHAYVMLDEAAAACL
jgi:glucosamine-6-phosphate isomerase